MSNISSSSSSIKSQSKQAILLQGVEETLLAATWCRAQDAASATPLLNDPYAQPTLDMCDVDYSRTTFASLHDERWARMVGGRGKALDVWCQEFLDTHADEPVQVVHIACGLDSRVLRVNRRPDVRWIDVDQPMVINLRERLFVGDWEPQGDYMMRNLSVTHPAWLRDVLQDRKTLVVAEGLLMYLEPVQAQKVIRDVVEHFGEAGGGKGGEMIFDTLGTVLQKKTDQVELLESSGAKFSWGVDDAKEVETLHPGLKLVKSRPWYQYMSTERRVSCAPPWFGPVRTKVAATLSSNFMDFAQIMRFEF